MIGNAAWRTGKPRVPPARARRRQKLEAK